MQVNSVTPEQSQSVCVKKEIKGVQLKVKGQQHVDLG